MLELCFAIALPALGSAILFNIGWPSAAAGADGEASDSFSAAQRTAEM